MADAFVNIKKGLVLLRLANTVLILINTGPSNVKSDVFLCIPSNWAGKQVHSTSSPNIAITLSSPTLSLL